MTEAIDPQSRERVGTVLDEKWTLERLLGVGGMAAVYAARHRNGAKAAVKVLHPELSRHREVRERFLREGYAANRVDHPGAVKVMDDDVISSGPDTGTAYLVMEILEGESLQDRIERGPPIGERAFLEIAESVLDVLEAAHSHGVVHRDLKPENLFMQKAEGEGKPRVKVLDFGLARLLDGHTITSHGLALGTPSFMSPEQAAGRIDEIDGRTDLFALAATAFRLRTGRRIHEAANAVELVTKMAQFAAPKIELYVPDVGKPFARVIDRALEFRREDRYASAEEMREDVRRAIREIDDGMARTQLALAPMPEAQPAFPPPSRPPVSSVPAAIPAVPREPKTEISAREPGSPLPALPGQPRQRRRRSILPWLTLALFAAIGVKLWMDRREVPASTPLPETPSALDESPPSPLGTAASLPPTASAAPVPVPIPAPSAPASATATPSATASATVAPVFPHPMVRPLFLPQQHKPPKHQPRFR